VLVEKNYLSVATFLVLVVEMASIDLSSLNGKVSVITGASSGIGLEIAKALAAAGVKVALGARREDRLVQLQKEIQNAPTGSKTAIVVTTDVTNKEQVRALISKAEKELGPVDILINNAGVMHLGNMKNIREDEWDRMVDVNIKGVLHGIGAALPKMLERKSGDIVNISSDAGRKVFTSGTVYCATKWAVEAITAGLRNELAGTGVRFLSIQPGATESELGLHIHDPEVIEQSKSRPKMKYLESVDVAKAVVFALSMPKHASINEIMLRPEQQGN